MPSSDPTLKRWYGHYNADLFAGDLPEDTVCFFEPCGGNLGLCELLDDEQFMIRLDPTLRFSDRLWKPTLIHEMAHIKLHPYTQHGRKFLAEIDRLYSLGAFRKLL